MDSGTSHALYGVWGTSSSDVYAVGSNIVGPPGTILHYDGTNWSAMTSPTDEGLLGVWLDLPRFGGQGVKRLFEVHTPLG